MIKYTASLSSDEPGLSLSVEALADSLISLALTYSYFGSPHFACISECSVIKSRSISTNLFGYTWEQSYIGKLLQVPLSFHLINWTQFVSLCM